MVTSPINKIFCNLNHLSVVSYNVNDQSDLILIKNVVAGEISSFRILVDRYKDLAIALAFNIVCNQQDAEDIAQDSFIKAYLSLKSFKGNSKFSTWFYRIVLNTSLNKKRLEKPGRLVAEEHLPELDEVNIKNNLNRFTNKEQKKFIQEAIGALTEGERVCVTMYYLNELSIEEINELTGFSVANIKVLLHRGRKHLYSELQRVLKGDLKSLI